MNNHQSQAITNFRSGLNCAQSVIGVYSEKYGIDKSTAFMMSCGFGAGMGRLQETCGAVTGSFMTIGLHICRKVSDNKERKEQSYALIREFDHRFKELHGTCRCADLLKLDLKTPEGQHEFHEKNMHETICEKCIEDAVKIVEDLIG
jgi:C_GCAxxG_C_C family probable redox protein